ncbi:M20 family metallopeptidase [Acetomicrobium sp. S15 = DSM 107314]|uniref:M20 family metallopeptidase n=1 Tax=Acetomicrobium sp. S15 = DSM 107314 TaxID=2529858 RepID=UPI0018E163D7|nr:M20 family metallopeptidase [Acetomicrobium sp. S15 = DSM 107314]
MTSEEVTLAQALVRIPSENPIGTEKEIGKFITNWLSRISNVEAKEYEVQRDRFNIVAILRGRQHHAGLAYVAHMDTVPVGMGWSEDPFGGTIKGNALYGRGSVDMKGGLAAAMVAFKRVAESGQQPQEDFLFCATVDEEGMEMLGAVDLANRGLIDRETVVLAPEPNSLTLTVEHKGVVWYEIEAIGKSAHAGNPQMGADAVLATGQAIVALKNLIEKLPYESEYLGRSTITFGRVEGGTKTNVVPNYARCEIDVRIVEPMSISQLTELITKTVNDTIVDSGISFHVRHINIDRPPVKAESDCAFVNEIKAAFRGRTGRGIEICGFPAYTDAAIISARTGNRYCYVFGPGALKDAHTVDEHIIVDEIEIATDVLTATAERVLFGK